ncbi:TRAP transporter solute receptor, TAXI family [Rubidibacter lacunae KORDI 51-2]|uniref:TRAP transporter solute receptor, TAXI family n=1 Tax=Rubidibacter lacunae KORDI 51-2 TaxID=582515 RepID=U5DDJ2_9CHRO|nr:TAXI family TRAP transporter solute-binding subunit [Rubidibacter lacunae]ERN42573.1 TRAP transporter solute receptor, TAXI family [Rubidibacter lacunae KORDI 51-2]
MNSNKKALWLFACGLALSAMSAVAVRAQSLYTIGTGGVTGVYYPVGGATSRIVNEADVGIRLTVESTGGSVFNVKAIAAEQLDLAVAQSDVVYQAFNGEAAFEGAAVEKLRSVMGLHPEPLHLVCRADAGVNSFRDIEGKRINIGNPGSGQLNIVRAMLAAYGMEESDFTAQYLKAAEAPDLLRDGRGDCFFYAVGIGAAAIRDISANTNVKIVPLKDSVLDGLIEQSPYFAYATLPAGTYTGQDTELTLFGVKALFVTSTDLSDDVVYKIVKSVLDNFDNFQATHPALANLTPQAALQGLGAPLHPGAARAYREAGFAVE